MGERIPSGLIVVSLASIFVLAGCFSAATPSRSLTPVATAAPSLADATPTPASTTTAPRAGWLGGMTIARTRHTATLLYDGRVLIVGGYSQGPNLSPSGLASAEIYDPRTGRFAVTGSMSVGREGYTSTLLPDGRVLITGGTVPRGVPDASAMPTASPEEWAGDEAEPPRPMTLASAEIYDPGTGRFAATGSMTTPRSYHTATALADGRVLIAGGMGDNAELASAELYDPKTGVSTPTGRMWTARSGHTATLLRDGRALVIGGQESYLAEAYDPNTGTFSRTGSLTTVHAGQTTTLLADGRVLVAGGHIGVPLGDGEGGYEAGPIPADTYDPETGVFSPTGTMVDGRSGFSATLLPDGRVLLAGGCGACDAGDAVASAEIYDPVTRAFSTTASRFDARVGHTATLLADGTVLIAGGSDVSVGDPLAWAEIYIPDTDTFSGSSTDVSPSPPAPTPRPTPTKPATTAGSMTTPRSGHTATLLGDGRVLVAGGSDCVKEEPYEEGWVECTPLAAAEIYDPATSSFSRTGAMTTLRGENKATLLADGRVLLLAGLGEIYDPMSGGFRRVADSEPIWDGSSATVLRDGRVLVAGGADYPLLEASGNEEWQALDKTAIYDPETGSFSPTGVMKTARMWPTAALLRDGRVLVTGGMTFSPDEGFDVALASAEIYEPTTGAFSLTGRMRTARYGYTATVLRDGHVLIAGGNSNADELIPAAELYDPTTRTFRPTGKLVTARHGHTATLLADGRVLITGGSEYIGDPYSAPTASAEIYDPGTGTFRRTGSMIVARAGYAATLLADGRVLITGGDASPDAEQQGPQIVASTEIYDPDTGTFSLAGR